MAEPKKPRKPRATKAQRDAVRKANEEAAATSRAGLNPSQDPGRDKRIERIRNRFEHIQKLKEGEKSFPLAVIPKPPPLHACQKLELFGIDEICRSITGGAMLRELCEAIDVRLSDLMYWIAKSEARAIAFKDARVAGALVYDEMALETLHDALGKPMQMVVAAKEIAAHYRWRASKLNPRDYGDKVEITERKITEIADEELVARLKQFGLDVPTLATPGTGMMGAAPTDANPQHISPGRAAGNNVFPMRSTA